MGYFKVTGVETSTPAHPESDARRGANLSHQSLLDVAVQSSAPFTERLRNAAFYVTGASGFLASNLLLFLSRLNSRFALNSRLYASARRTSDKVVLFDYMGWRPDVEWEVAPVEQATLPNVNNLVVIHTASYGSPRDYLAHPLETFEANTQGLVWLLKQCDPSRVRQFVFISSAEVYGQPPEAAIPTPESFVGGLETLSRRSIYGESKRMAEVLGVCLAQEKGIPFTALRPWNLYGPGQRLRDGRVPVEFMRQALEDGSIRLASNGMPRRAFCYVWDGVRQIAAALLCRAPVAAFNVGQGAEETRILELARRCALLCNLPETAVHYDPSAMASGLERCAPDVGAVERLAGSTNAFTPLASGLAVLKDWVEFARKL